MNLGTHHRIDTTPPYAGSSRSTPTIAQYASLRVITLNHVHRESIHEPLKNEVRRPLFREVFTLRASTRIGRREGERSGGGGGGGVNSIVGVNSGCAHGMGQKDPRFIDRELSNGLFFFFFFVHAQSKNEKYKREKKKEKKATRFIDNNYRV